MLCLEHGLFEVLSLFEGPWEAVNEVVLKDIKIIMLGTGNNLKEKDGDQWFQYSDQQITYLGWSGEHSLNKKLDCEMVWHEASIIHNTLDFFSFFCTLGYCLPQEVSCGDMGVTELFYELVALCSFARGGAT